jgi:hypothetical protein
MPTIHEDIPNDINPIENGVQQVYTEIREALELILMADLGPDDPIRPVLEKLIELDDALGNNWDELMAAFWRGVRQDIDLMEGV